MTAQIVRFLMSIGLEGWANALSNPEPIFHFKELEQPIKPPEVKPSDEWLRRLESALGALFDTDQKKAVRLILLECKEHEVADARQIAYVLATCYHECRFKSIKEYRAKAGTDVWKMQERYWHTGFYGRGFCQLTWKGNYEKFSAIIGRDLVNNPDLVLLPEVGAKILVRGMRDGLFSGKKLSDYLNAPPGRLWWLSARKIVNGTFQAERVRDAALKILPLL